MRDATSELIFNHSSRVYLFGALAGIVLNGDADKVITLAVGQVDPQPDAESPRVG